MHAGLFPAQDITRISCNFIQSRADSGEVAKFVMMAGMSYMNISGG